MNTQLFKYALEVEKAGSITQAADNLFMAQPNLSKAIKELEDTVGFPVFKRTSKGVFPTKKGAQFLIHAKSILLQMEQIESLSDKDAPDTQSFSVSMPRGSYIAAAFTKFVSELDESRGINVNVEETNSLQIIQNVAEGRFHLGIIRYQSRYENYFLDYLAEKELVHEPLWEFEYLALMSARHPLAEAEEVSAEELRRHTEIVHGDTVIPYLADPEAGKPLKSRRSKKIYLYERCNQFDLLASIPTTYMWVSPVPESFLERYDLVQRKCPAEGHKHKDLLIRRKDYVFSALDKKFLALLHGSKEEVASKGYR